MQICISTDKLVFGINEITFYKGIHTHTHTHTNISIYIYIWASQVALVVKNSPSNAGDMRDTALIPESGRSPGEGMATHSSILAWRIP